MDDLVRIRSGALDGRAEMPLLKPAEIVNGKKLGSELGFRTDTEELYIGTNNGNKKIGDAKWETRINGLEKSISNLEGQTGKISTIEAQIQAIMTRLEALHPSE